MQAFCGLLIAALFVATDMYVAVAAPPIPYLVKDINNTTPGSDPEEFVVLDDVVYFYAEDRSGIRNLWKSDGTPAGTVLVKEMAVEQLTPAGGMLFFVRGVSTGELWKSDGTTDGTVLVKDLESEGTNVSLRALVEFDGVLFFIVDSNDSGYALWKSDGSAAGTTLVKQISPTSIGVTSHYPTVVGDTLFFVGDNPFTGSELWKSDGTSAGTMLVKDINPLSENGDPSWLTAVGDTLFFSAIDGTHGRELWKSDGTEAGTVLVKDIRPNADSSTPASLTAVGNTLFFSAYTSASGRELWKSDGTEAGTMIVKEIVAGAEEAFPQALTAVGDTLYFNATTNSKGDELWKSDGTEAGTKLVKDIEAGEDGSSPARLTDVDGTLFFVAYTEARGEELWKSDGTSNGTKPVKDVNPLDDFGLFGEFTAFGSMLIFRADDGTHGIEIWGSDGTKKGTKMLKDLRNDSLDSEVGEIVPAGALGTSGGILFRAKQEESGRELWISDGTEAGTKMVKDIFGGSDSGFPTAMVYFNGAYYFNATTNAKGIELWKSDGTEAGTQLVKDIYDGVFDSDPTVLTPSGSNLFFVATDGTTGKELWKSDGTTGGTVLVKDIYPNGEGSSPTELTDVDGTLFFVAEDNTFVAGDGTRSRGLWKSDGTTAGTTQVASFYPADGSAARPYNLNRLGNRLLFWIGRSHDDDELWVSDGTPAGTTKIKVFTDLFFDYNSTTIANNLLFFVPELPDPNALWVSDGTGDGTKLIKTFGTIDGERHIHSIHTIGAKAYIAVTDRGSVEFPNQIELWQSDGTAQGTVLLKTISANSGATTPDNVTDLNLQLFFVLGSCNTGQEIWASDGSAGGTVLLTDAVPDFGGNCLGNLTRSDENLFFTETDAQHGRELWAINLGDPLPGKIVLEKRTVPIGVTDTFPFAGDFSGTLRDREPHEILNVLPAAYTITEADAAPNYYLYDMSCDDGSSITPSTWNISARKLMLNVDSGETIRCVSYSAVPGKIKVSKSANRSQATVGETITYTYRITNSGAVTLTGVIAVDDQLGPIALSSTTLAPDAVATGAKSYTVVAADLPGPLRNTVTVTGTALGGPLPTDNVTLSLALTSSTALNLRKTANVALAAVGDPIRYTYQLRNDGDEPLTEISVVDAKLGTITLGQTTLAPNEAISSTKIYTVTSADLPGPLQSSVTVSYKSGGKAGASQTDGASVVIGNVLLTIDANQSGMLSYTGPDGKKTTVAAPFGAVNQETTLLYRSVIMPTSPPAAGAGFQFAGKAFELLAYQGGKRVEGLTFAEPISLTIEYTDADVAGLDEKKLEVRYYDIASKAWRTDGITMIRRDIEQNRIVVTITHLTEFALWGTPPTPVDPPDGKKERLYLPLVSS